MRFFLALALSVLAHGLLAVFAWLAFRMVGAPDVPATLDLTSVELSLAERDVETAVPVASWPSTPATKKAPSVPLESQPLVTVGDVVMPALDEPRPPEARDDAPELPEFVEKVTPESAPSEPTPTVAPQQARVEAPPHPRRTIRPNYPMGARIRKEQGDVVLEIRVTVLGRVADVKVAASSGFKDLDEAAVKAALSARFEPAKSDGVSVESTARLKLAFRLK